MRWTKTLIPTLRQTPAEAVVASHQLMLRAGLIQQVASGAYSYLPLGHRVLRKVMEVIRREMDSAGAAEVFLPALQPIELWETTGRREAYGENLFVLKDRHGREQTLGPTHEEVITELVRNSVHSYRDLPLTLYQIQTKFRDEFRPRFGVLRSREFQMKDAYSFDLDIDGLDESYETMYAAYQRIFEHCGLEYVIVEAEAGPIGGNASHEFMIPSPTGEDVILSSDKGNYAANVEKCEIGDRPVSSAFSRDLQGSAASGESQPTGDLEKIHTPGMATIEDVGKFMKVKPKNMLKTLVAGAENGWIIAVVRGDHDLNEAKLRAACGFEAAELAEDTAARDAGFTIGFVGPHAAVGRNDVQLIIDPDAARDQFWASGANEADHHVKHFNWQRDVLDPLGDEAGERVLIADIRNAVEGDPSPKNDGGILHESRGIEVGHVFKLGTKYSEALGLSVLDDQQQERSVLMGCYGIGVNRILAAAIESERGHDDSGIIWPMAIAPYHAVLTPIKYAPGSEVQKTVDRLYDDLTAAGVEVLLDDRDERPGVKFKDADLIGIPLRITVGDKGLAHGEVELKPRTADKAEMVPVDHAVGRVVEIVEAANRNGK